MSAKSKINVRNMVPALALSAAAGFAAVNLALAATTHMVSEKGKVFSEKKLEIATGDTVVFMNDDKVKHNILISAMKFDSGLQDKGAKTEVKFAEAGKFKVRCAIHPKMKMTVMVK